MPVWEMITMMVGVLERMAMAFMLKVGKLSNVK